MSFPRVESLIVASVVPCKKWIDCANRDDENFCIVKSVLTARGFVESFSVGELRADFFARSFVARFVFPCPLETSFAVLSGEIETRGRCKNFALSKVDCPECNARVSPSAVSVCPNCSAIRCDICREKIGCGNCGRELCPECVVLRPVGKTYKFESCYSCGARV